MIPIVIQQDLETKGAKEIEKMKSLLDFLNILFIHKDNLYESRRI